MEGGGAGGSEWVFDHKRVPSVKSQKRRGVGGSKQYEGSSMLQFYKEKDLGAGEEDSEDFDDKDLDEREPCSQLKSLMKLGAEDTPKVPMTTRVDRSKGLQFLKDQKAEKVNSDEQ